MTQECIVVKVDRGPDLSRDRNRKLLLAGLVDASVRSATGL